MNIVCIYYKELVMYPIKRTCIVYINKNLLCIYQQELVMYTYNELVMYTIKYFLWLYMHPC